MFRKRIYLIVFILLASFALISIDFYTIKILSGVRAYINGESEYSKGQKDAMLYLYTYVETEDPSYKAAFLNALKIPMADNLARKSLLNNDADEVATGYFLVAKNHSGDIPDMIWLFKMFKSTYMKTPIRLWTEAEPLINRLYDIGNNIDAQIKKGALTRDERLRSARDISQISTELYRKQSAFSEVLGNTARKINMYLLLINTFCVFVIIGSIALYATFMIKKLRTFNTRLQVKNKEVVEVNKELDTLIYSLSHDLRAPINSIRGLIGLLKEEDDQQQVKEYAEMIDEAVSRQDTFIQEIIDFFKSKRTSDAFKEFSIKKLVADIVTNHRFTPLALQIAITEEHGVDTIYSDELKLKMIIANLVSNAIKYSDQRKTSRTICIKTAQVNNEIVIEIADNGIGIANQYLDKIYNMFFVASGAKTGSGLGLYILKQNIEKLHGRVEVTSELGVGTTFIVHIPLAPAATDPHVSELDLVEQTIA